jgi:hypothetical protein
LDDSKKFGDLIERVMGLTRDVLPFDQKVVKGNTVYMLPVGDMLRAQGFEQRTPTPIGVLAFTVSKTHFFVTTHVELLDKVLNFSGPESLAGSAGYRKIASKFEPATSWISYVRTRESFRVTWEQVKSGRFAESVEQAFSTRPAQAEQYAGVVEALRGSNLPPFDAVHQYFLSSGTYSVMSDTMLKIVSFSLKN